VTRKADEAPKWLLKQVDMAPICSDQLRERLHSYQSARREMERRWDVVKSMCDHPREFVEYETYCTTDTIGYIKESVDQLKCRICLKTIVESRA
jgi:hypothetical protein